MKSQAKRVLINKFLEFLKKKQITGSLFGGFLRRLFCSKYSNKPPHEYFLDGYDLDIQFQSRVEIVAFIKAVNESNIFKLKGVKEVDTYPNRHVFSVFLCLEFQLYGDRINVPIDLVINKIYRQKNLNSDFSVNSYLSPLASDILNLTHTEIKEFETMTCVMNPCNDNDDSDSDDSDDDDDKVDKRILFQWYKRMNRLKKMINEGWRVLNLLHYAEITNDNKLCWKFPCGHNCIHSNDQLTMDGEKNILYYCDECSFLHLLID